jgi:16S rRNA (adenine1518-N6/adenine1519-N6)-dimethyltransferase
MEKVKAKKHLGQHFLIDESIAAAIAGTLNFEGYEEVLEIGPGMGVLTKYLLEKPITTHVIEIDTESVTYLENNFPKLRGKIISKDFLKYDINETFEGKQFGIIGNFPYNISSQILFKILDWKESVPVSIGMFQETILVDTR